MAHHSNPAHLPDQIKNLVIEKLSRGGQAVLIAGLILILTLLIVPLPPLLLDFLLAINMAGVFSLLMVAVFITDATKLASFPSLMLLTTLFRLALNLSSSRMILSRGEAGEIIETFGEFAIGGNLLVGIPIFFLLTVIQFLVVNKGSERVAEVAARFSLDAMPGRQMSIDADLRAGLITQAEAQGRRRKLQLESRLFGSLDGAMKFVKGDTIAGVLVLIINIFGGLATGVLQHGWPILKALKILTILSVGDGLVSQIPSLLTALTAGFIVTRVSDGEEGKNGIGTDMGFQVFSQPRALLVTSLVCLFLGMIPGFPLAVFALIAFFLAGVSLYQLSAVKRAMGATRTLAMHVVESSATVVPFSVEVGPELYRIFGEDPRWNFLFTSLYPRLCDRLTAKLGVSFPELKLTVNDTLGGSYHYHICIFEVPIEHGFVNPRHCALLGETSGSSAITPPQTTAETVYGTRLSLWALKSKEDLSRQGLKTLGPEELFLRHLNRVLTRYASEFMGIQEVRELLNVLEESAPELVREVVPGKLSLYKLTEILRRLVEEEVSIRDLRLILQVLSACQPESKDYVTLTEQVRLGLGRAISARYVNPRGEITYYRVDAAIEDEIRQSIQKNGEECFLALHPERLTVIVKAFEQVLRGASTRLLLTHQDIRRYLKKLGSRVYTDLVVLSYQELDPALRLNCAGVVGLADEIAEAVA